MPLTMKKTGMTKPNPIASSLDRTTGLSAPWLKRRTTTPAVKAPRSTSRPSSDATHTSRITARTEIRTGSCELELRCLLNRATTRGGVGRAASSAATTARTMNATRSSEVRTGLSLVSRRAIATMGPNSPTEPIASTNAPIRVSATPESRSIGSRVPSAVVVSARPISRLDRAKPELTSTNASPKPSTRDIAHPSAARVNGVPLTRSRSMSNPARNIRKQSPRLAKACTRSPVSARPRTCGPITMPRPISSTTAGTRRRRSDSAPNGASTAAALMRTRDTSAELTSAA